MSGILSRLSKRPFCAVRRRKGVCHLNNKKEAMTIVMTSFGRGRKARTLDTRFWRPLLYQLSYTPVWWAFGDSNPGPDGYEPSALTN